MKTYSTRPFEAWDVFLMFFLDSKDSPIPTDEAEKLEGPWSKTIWYGDEPIVVVGVQHFWAQRGVGWSYFSPRSEKHMLAITRIGKSLFDAYPLKRIEAYVDMDFEKGHRYMKILGFEKEVECARGIGPLGQDATVYVRIKE